MAANTYTEERKDSGSKVLGSLGTLFEKRWLIWYFIQREISKSYRGSFLGFAWAFLTPLLMIFLYTLVFSEIIGIRFREVEGDSSLNFGLYLYCGLMPFLAFSEALNQSTNVIKSNSSLVSKMVFPVEILPLSTAVTSIVDKIFGLAMLVLVLLVLGAGISWTLLLLPILVVSQLFFTLGLCYLFAVIGTYLPDVRETLRSFVRALFFLTPIIWPASRVEGTPFEFVVAYNPLAFLVQSYRDVVILGEIPDIGKFLLFTVFALALFAAGFALFTRVKRRFADLV